MLDATERRTLITCSFLSGCILLGPQEFRAAAVPFTISAALLVWHLKLRKKERRDAAPPAPPPPAPGGAPSSPEPSP
jgi:hypothetical protein